MRVEIKKIIEAMDAEADRYDKGNVVGMALYGGKISLPEALALYEKAGFEVVNGKVKFEFEGAK